MTIKINSPYVVRKRILELRQKLDGKTKPPSNPMRRNGAIIGRFSKALAAYDGNGKLDPITTDSNRHLVWGWVLCPDDSILTPTNSGVLMENDWAALSHWMQSTDSNGQFRDRQEFADEAKWVLTVALHDTQRTDEAVAAGEHFNLGRFIEEGEKLVPKNVDAETPTENSALRTAIELGGQPLDISQIVTKWIVEWDKFAFDIDDFDKDACAAFVKKAAGDVADDRLKSVLSNAFTLGIDWARFRLAEIANRHTSNKPGVKPAVVAEKSLPNNSKSEAQQISFGQVDEMGFPL